MTEHVKKEYCTCDGAGTCSGCCLFTCAVCGGAEGSLPTRCPGRRMTPEEDMKIYYDELDYVEDKWRRSWPEAFLRGLYLIGVVTAAIILREPHVMWAVVLVLFRGEDETRST